MSGKAIRTCVLIAAVVALAFPSLGLAQSAASPLKLYEGLKGKDREQKLSEGAKKEGRVVVYSFTAVDQLQPLLEEFQKRYPFIKPARSKWGSSPLLAKNVNGQKAKSGFDPIFWLRNFVNKTELLIHVRSRKYHPQTIGREERCHGSLKLEHLYRVLPNNRGAQELSTVLQLRTATHEPGVPHTGCGVSKQGRPSALTYPSGIVFRIRGTGQIE